MTGTVYNGDNQVPYSLPDNKTKGGMKTDSSKGHGGYNEIVFEDKKNSEQIGMHAQKDLNIVVLNSETREIGANFMVPMGSPSLDMESPATARRLVHRGHRRPRQSGFRLT